MAKVVTLLDQAVTALNQTHGFSLDERQAIIRLIREQTMWTHAVDQACSVVHAQIGERDFQWPEFDRWHTIFAKRGVFPPLWEGLERLPRRGDSGPAWQAYRKRKLYLLIDWLHGLVVTRAEMRAALTRYAARDLQAEIARQRTEVTCPACDPLDHGNVPPNSRDVPPFHPGCRCLIVALHPTTRLA